MPSPSRRATRAAAAVLVLLGVLLVVASVLAATAFRPADELVATAELDGEVPVAVTAPGVLDLAADRVVVRARGASGAPVFVGVGREVDVEAYLADAPRAELVGLASEQELAVDVLPGPEGAAAPPDPAAVDVWVAEVVGDGSAELTWDHGPGRWLLVVASDGASPAPGAVTLAWPQEGETPLVVPLAAAGGACLLAALLLVVLPALARRERREVVEVPGSGEGQR